MLFSSLFKSAALAACFVSSVSAAPAQHVHNQHKRDVVVVTETVVVTADAPQVVAGESTTVTFATFASGAPTTDASESTVTREQQHAGSEAPVAGSVVASPVATAASAAPSAAQSASLPVSDNSFSGKGVTYSPYTSTGQCKSLQEVQSDVAKLSNFEIIRLYGVDCNQVENVLQAKAQGQKLFLGVFFMDQIQAGVSQIASAIKQHGSWNDVYTVSIGNELVNAGLANVGQVASYVSTGRAALKAAGYNGPVVSVDTHIATINNPGLCDISDYIAINAHAYFDFNTAAQDAGPWLLEQIQRVWTTCGGHKDVFVTESGWPHQGDTYGKAIASPEAQKAAISSLKSAVGKSVILFNAFNDYWKADGFLNCEKYWGIY